MKEVLFSALLLTVYAQAEMPTNLHTLTVLNDDEQRVLLISQQQDDGLSAAFLGSWREVIQGSYNGDWLGRVIAMDGKQGYIDAKGKVVIKPQFDDARAFTEDGIARVQVDEKWGFIQRGAKELWLVKPTFYHVTPFSQGLAAVSYSKDSPSYYIDKQGKKAFDKTFARATKFSDNGLAAVGIGRKIPVFVVTPKQTLQKVVTKDVKWGYINIDGEMVIPATYQHAFPFNQLGIARIEDDSEKERLIDTVGQLVSPTAFRYIWTFNELGYAKAETEEGVEGVINRKGEFIWKINTYEISELYNELYKGRNNRFFDVKGNPVIKEPSRWAQPFVDAAATIAMREGQWGILSRQGDFQPFPKHIVAPLLNKKGYVDGFETGLVAMVDEEGGLTYFNRTGDVEYRFVSSDAGTMVLEDKKGLLIWKSDIKNTKHHSLLAIDISVFTDASDYGDGIYQTIDNLLNAEPKRFHIPNPVYYENDDPYNLDEEVDIAGKGSIKVLAQRYVGEETWGMFDFLMDNDSKAFGKFYQHLVQKITERHGAPITKNDSNYGETHWRIGDKRLTLDNRSETGDGDYYYQLVLTVTALNNEENK